LHDVQHRTGVEESRLARHAGSVRPSGRPAPSAESGVTKVGSETTFSAKVGSETNFYDRVPSCSFRKSSLTFFPIKPARACACGKSSLTLHTGERVHTRLVRPGHVAGYMLRRYWPPTSNSAFVI
jgi:hypothetical protein